MNIVKRLGNAAVLTSALILSSNVMAACAKDLSLGWEEWIPYQQMVDGKLSGLDIELVTAIVKNMGCEIKYINAPWARHLEELKLGNIDLAAAASKTAEREVFANFSDPYRQEKISLFVLKDTEAKYPLKALNDIVAQNFKLGVVRGFEYGDAFAALKDNTAFQDHLEYVQTTEQNISKLTGGRINGFLEDPVVAVMNLKKNNVMDKIVQHSFVVNEDNVHIMFSKKSTTDAMLADFNKSLKQLKDNGEYQKILDKYLK